MPKITKKRKHSEEQKDYDPTIPLELVDSKIWGPLDKDQIFFRDNGASDLVLLENASEIFARFMMSEQNIEDMSSEVLGKYNDIITILPSETFPEQRSIEDFSNNKKRYKKYLEEWSDDITYKITNYIKTIKKNGIDLSKRFIVAMFSINMDYDDVSNGGHYCAFILHNKIAGIKSTDMTGKVEIFDSMFIDQQGSVYTNQFRYIAKEIFGKNGLNLLDESIPNIALPNCVKTPNQSVQRTGGFPENKAHDVYEYINKVKYLYSYQRISETLYFNTINIDIPKINIQHIDSQNHYCYIWAFWYINMRLIQLLENPLNTTLCPMKDVFEKIGLKELIPLVMIKTYINCILNSTNIGKKFYKDLQKQRIKKFFDTNFMSIWHYTNLDEDPSLDFSRYDIISINCRIDDCFKKSINSCIQIIQK